MPELPEVETIRKDLESEIIGLTFTKVVLLWEGSLKDISLKEFNNQIIDQKIIAVTRRAKNLAIRLENGQNILMHMKMTGHLLLEPADVRFDKSGNWRSADKALQDPFNQYVRLVFWLNNGKILAFSDLRKFGYIKLVDDSVLEKIFSEYGPEPLSPSFNVKFLTDLFSSKKQAIKKVIMDQKNIAGIGNIYADEILFATGIHPETPANNLKPSEVAAFHKKTREILEKAIRLRGTSTSDYRDTKGKKGNFEKMLKVYRQTGKECPNCGEKIERITVGGRGTHFCPKCQTKEPL